MLLLLRLLLLVDAGLKRIWGPAFQMELPLLLLRLLLLLMLVEPGSSPEGVGETLRPKGGAPVRSALQSSIHAPVPLLPLQHQLLMLVLVLLQWPLLRQGIEGGGCTCLFRPFVWWVQRLRLLLLGGCGG